MSVKSAAAVVLMGLMLGACQPGAGPKENVGGLTGAVAGGLLGAQFGGGSGKILTAGAGALLGGLVGSNIGRDMDERDRQYWAETQYEALESGPPGAARGWSNPSSGHSGSIVPGPSYTINQYTCRDYTHRVIIDGRTEDLRGTACRQPDGTWRPVS